MFFYISFLRPPPCQASSDCPFTITPQITNDLRTEPLPDGQGIYYAWHHIPRPEPTSRGKTRHTPKPFTTKPQKLTTWRQATAYKDIRVPLLGDHARAHAGGQWRLVLTTEAFDKSEPHCIDIKGDNLGARPFAVMSMSINFILHRPLSLAKQDRIERVYRFPTLDQSDDAQHAYLIVQECTSFDLDKVNKSLGTCNIF
jgi:protein N-lysine methyltransferase METTL21D